jgi:hypothetical protein
MKLLWPFGTSRAAKQRAAERAKAQVQGQQMRSASEASNEEFDYFVERIRALIGPYYRRIRSFPILLNADTRRAIERFHQQELPQLRLIQTELEGHRSIPGFDNLQMQMLAGVKLFVQGQERFYAALHGQTTQEMQYAYRDGQDMTRNGARMALLEGVRMGPLQMEYPSETGKFGGWEAP